MKETPSLRELLIASGLYATSSIIGPLALFGGAGMLLDSFFATSPWLLLGGVFIAFVTTNILLYRKLATLNKLIDEQRDKPGKQS